MNRIMIVVLVMVLMVCGGVQGMTIESSTGDDVQQEEFVISGGQEYMTRRDVTLEIVCASIGIYIALNPEIIYGY